MSDSGSVLDKCHIRSSSPGAYQQSKLTFFLSKTIVTWKHLYTEIKASSHIPMIIENVCVVCKK